MTLIPLYILALHRKISLLIVFLFAGTQIITAQMKNHQKTGFFTRVYAREHLSDMPRRTFLLFEEDGTVTTLGFWSNNQSKGVYSKPKFDPRDFLGKIVSINVEGTENHSNNEFVYYEDGELKVTPIISVKKINSFEIIEGKKITVPTEYRQLRKDTLLMPHDITIEYDNYADKISNKTVKLTDYVRGKGTEKRPYRSDDGKAGLKAAIADLPNGGTIEVPSGTYEITTKGLKIPRFVSIKGTGKTKPTFIVKNERIWSLKGSNTIDFINLDFTQIERRYTHEVIRIDNNARDVKISNSKFVGDYAVDPETHKESGNIVFFRLYSNLKNITFEKDTIVAPLRGIVTKGQKNHENIIIKDCVFKDQGQMCISMDQVSNIHNVVIDNNKFIEFSHFGVALARINDAKITNNTFYSRNLESFNMYNQAIHIEEHCQNFLIENNTIDVTLRNKGSYQPNSTVRSYGMILSDTRNLVIKNNIIKHSDIVFSTVVTNNIAGFSEFSNNTLEDGSIHIRDAQQKISIENNKIINPPKSGISFSSTKHSSSPSGKHQIKNNQFLQMEGKKPFEVKGKLEEIIMHHNSFQGCDEQSIIFHHSIDLKNNIFRK